MSFSASDSPEPQGRRAVMLILLCVLAISCSLVRAVPPKQYLHENFDPSLADPEYGVSCVGEVADLGEALPRMHYWDPNTVSMNSLCVKPQYGGGQPYQHLGAYCYTTNDPFGPEDDHGFDYYHGAVAFDKDLDARSARWLQNPRMLLQCRLRCFCNKNVPLEARNVQPAGTSFFYRTQQGFARDAYRFQIDVLDDYDTRYEAHLYEPPTPRMFTEVISTISEVGHRRSDALHGYQRVAMTRANNVVCEGPMPDWPLPGPPVRNGFGNLQEMCAVQLSGGRAEANAGGYCHRVYAVQAPPVNEVWFSDAFTPRVDWTWNNFLASASIRFHCRRFCRCKYPGEKTEPNNGNAVWQFILGLSFISKWDGSTQVARSGTGETLMQVLPPQSGAGPSAGTCGPDGKQFCPTPWPLEILGPIPRGPPGSNMSGLLVAPANPADPRQMFDPDDATDGSASTSNATDASASDADLTSTQGQCGASCTGVAECRSPGAGVRCTCKVPNWREAVTAGLDPVFPTALCIALATQMVNPVPAPPGLGRREVLEDDEAMACACNATYVSHSCCGSEDGMIWEDPGLKLGRMAESD
ncbi:MAG: hypothetical protein M1817_000652 [Caeruleum heppii]|nr:MAG: hypothetical protein M1817_000652 [Caeruleum heppii]